MYMHVLARHAGFAKFTNFLRLYTCDSQFARRSHIENEDRREVPRYLLGNLFVALTFLASGCMKQLASCRSWRCRAFYG